MKKYVLILGLFCNAIILVVSCGPSTGKEESKTKGDSSVIRARGLTLISRNEDLPPGFKVDSLFLDTSFSKPYLSEGIHMNMLFSVDTALFDQIRKQQWDVLFLDIVCTPEKGKPIILKETLTQSNKNVIVHVDKGLFVSTSGSKALKLHFPFAQMEASAGKQKVTLTAELRGIRLKKEGHSVYQSVEQFSETGFGHLDYTVEVLVPPLKKVALTVSELAIDSTKTNVHRYDFHVTGPGYPDLFWGLSSGENFVYYAPEKRNSLEYTQAQTSTAFWCTERDTLSLMVADYDNGPFNAQEEIIETWSGTLPQMRQQSGKMMSLGKLSRLKFSCVEQ